MYSQQKILIVLENKIGDVMYINRLKEIREDFDLLQKDVAKALNIKQQQYSEYEIGKRLIPINYLNDLADLYNTSIDYLLYKTDVRKPYPKSIVNKIPINS